MVSSCFGDSAQRGLGINVISLISSRIILSKRESSSVFNQTVTGHPWNRRDSRVDWSPPVAPYMLAASAALTDSIQA